MFKLALVLVSALVSVSSALSQNLEIIKTVQFNDAEIKEYTNQFAGIKHSDFSVAETDAVPPKHKLITPSGPIFVFFTPPLPYAAAKAFCLRFHARLAAINEQNFRIFTAFLRAVGVSPVYIGSWDGDNYGGNSGIALFAASQFGIGAIAVPAGAPGLPLPGLCVVF